MTGFDRPAPVASLFKAACLVSVLALSGCTGFKQAIGLEEQPPDEFAVETRAPLTIPPEFDLRPPEPGAQRPQEATAAARVRQEIDAAGPGQPGKQASSLPQLPGIGSGPDPNQEIGPNTLAARLLTANDIAGGATIESRHTSALKGVY